VRPGQILRSSRRGVGAVVDAPDVKKANAVG
jgi:hypothetical protein